MANSVKRLAWHHVVLSPDAHIVLFERWETGMQTTDYAELPAAMVDALRALFSIGKG